MPIVFNCACGKTLRVPDASAGKRAKCPACAAVVAVPAPEPPPEPEPEFEIVEEPPAPVVPVAPPAPAYKKPFADEDEDDDRGTYGIAAPEKPDPKSPGAEARPPRLPNFRRGTENHT